MMPEEQSEIGVGRRHATGIASLELSDAGAFIERPSPMARLMPRQMKTGNVVYRSSHRLVALI